jgi:hypothetical protein
MRKLIGGGVMAVAATMFVSAQAKPDFTGTWLEDRERLTNLVTGQPIGPPNASGGALPLPPGETVVTHTANVLEIERKVPKLESSLRYAYKLDGSKSVNHNGAQTRTTTTRWEANKLVTEGTIFEATSQGERHWVIREVMYLENGELMHELEWKEKGEVTTATRRVYRRAEIAPVLSSARRTMRAYVTSEVYGVTGGETSF